MLTCLGVAISMNPKSSPWRNGSQESFFGRFKVEFGDFDRFDTYADLLEALYEELRYFTDERIKTKLKMAPAEFRVAWDEKQATLSTPIHSYSQVMSLPPPRCSAPLPLPALRAGGNAATTD
jgi:hypothetical protein